MLNVSHLNVFYGRKKAINDVSFTIKSGEIVGLIGPNGAGKTTIMKTLLGLTKFTGTVSFNQQQITASSHQALQEVGALIENPAVYPFLSGRANLALYSRDRSDLDQLIKKLGMASYIDQLAKAYSIGMKQKLGIALALINHPQLVILDEPMNGLDIEATILIRKIIAEYAAQGTAFIISSHVLSELQKVMTRVMILNHRQIIMNTPISQFRDVPAKYYLLQSTDNKQLVGLLMTQHIQAAPRGRDLLVGRDDLDRVQQIVYASGLRLRRLVPVQETFEQAIVKILREGEAK